MNLKKSSGEELRRPNEKACQTYACAIQECLKRRDYDEKKCRKEIERWRACLEQVQEESMKHDSYNDAGRR